MLQFEGDSVDISFTFRLFLKFIEGLNSTDVISFSLDDTSKTITVEEAYMEFEKYLA